MLKYLLEKECKLFLRHKFLPRIAVLFPFIAMGIFPLVTNMEIKNIRLLIVDHDNSSFSRRLIDKIKSSEYFILTEEMLVPNIYEKMETDNIDEILEIPADFERVLFRENRANVMISSNAVNGMKASLSSSYLSQIIADYNQDLYAEMYAPSMYAQMPKFDIIPIFLYNPAMKSIYNIIPALLVMVMGMICGFLPTLNIVQEKEKGTIEQMNVTPVNKFTLIASKLIPYWVVGFIVLTISILAAWLFYGFLPKGSVVTVYLFEAIFVLAMSGFGLVISNYARTIQQAMFIMFFFIMIFVFLSGLYTPFSNMPQWAQTLGHISPMKYIIQVLRMVYLKGSGVRDLYPQFLALFGLAIFFNFWAILSYKKIRN